MNEVMQHPQKTPSLYADKGDALLQLESPLEKQQAVKLTPLIADEEKLQPVSVNARYLITFLPLFGFIVVAGLWLMTDDIIKKEGYKALTLILLLLQIKNFSHTIKK
ncbi:MAG TPA: hypothetical protein VEY32_08795 [Flavisolibacter sp.]|jgi:hypothetical protein|nr:hypothetical protein [Flavisolibacter sp.]